MNSESMKFDHTFGSIRENVLGQVWIEETNRKLWHLEEKKYTDLIYDTYSDSYECSWQNNADELKSDINWHVPHFCSLGDWARNVTDILTDMRYDDLNFVDELDQEFLFRYYTRLLLIVSELLADFEQILKDAKLTSNKNQSARRQLLSNNVSVEKLMEYVNTVCKHKNSQKFHYHNHHLKFWFEDSNESCQFNDPISLSRPKYDQNEKPDGIAVPSLFKIVTAVTDSYKTVDQLFLENPNEFNGFCLDKGAEYREE